MPLTTPRGARHNCSSGLPARWSRSKQLLCPWRRRSPVSVSAGGRSAMKFHVVCNRRVCHAHSPIRVVEQTTGREVGWINRFLDREYVRRVANTSLRIYAYNLLHFLRWWNQEHHTSELALKDLTESTLLDYLRFQSGLESRPAASTINDRVADAERAIRHEFPQAPCQVAHGYH